MYREKKVGKRERTSFAAKLVALAALLALAILRPDLYRKLTDESWTHSYVSSSDASGTHSYVSPSGERVREVNGGVPSFSDEDFEAGGKIRLSELDELGRCGSAFMIVSKATMAKGERGDISAIKPTGWKTVKYPKLIRDEFLYNRCHLLGRQLSGLDAEERNLITGTRYFNATLMLEYENRVADYVKSSGRRVAYRVTPDFRGDELVARGVTMEALSLADGGKALSFAVYVPNVQPGIEIDYADGSSRVAATGEPGTERW